MTDKTTMDVALEADATQAVRASGDAAKALIQVLNSVKDLEAGLKAIFTGTIPKGMEQLEAYAMRVKEVSADANTRAARLAARSLSSGGPAALIQRATYQGALANLKNDPAYQALQYEKEATKVAEARYQIYKRMRGELGGDRALTGYRKGLEQRSPAATQGMSPERARAERTRFLAETRAEQKRFEVQLSADHAEAMEARIANDQRLAEREKNRLDRAARDRRQAYNFQTSAEEQNMDGDRLLADRENSERNKISKAKRQAYNFQTSADELNQRFDETTLSRAFSLEKQIIASEKEIQGLRSRGTETDTKHAEVIQRQVNELRQERDELIRIEGLEEKIALARAKEAAKPQAQAKTSTAQSPEDIARKQVDARRARFDVDGGYGMFAAEAHGLANYAIMGAAIGGIASTVKAVVDLDNALKLIQGTTQATDLEMNNLSRNILSVAASSNISTADLAKAAESIATAGYSVKEVGNMLKPIQVLATATRSSMEESQQAAVTTLKTWDMASEQTGKVTNALAELSLKSRLPMVELAKGLKNVGEIAKGSEVQFQEVAASFAAMAEGGMRDGAQMGSSLKALIEAFDNPSKKLITQLSSVGLTVDDVNIRTHGLSGALQILADHHLTAAQAMSAMNVRAQQAYVAMSENIGVFNKTSSSILASTSATDTAATQMQSLESRFKELTGASTQLALTGLGPMINFMGKVASAAVVVVQAMDQMGPVLQLVVTALAAVATSTILVMLGNLVGGFIASTVAARSWQIAMLLCAVTSGDLAGALTVLNLALGPVGWLSIGMMGAVAAFSLFAGASDSARRKTEELHAATDAATEKTRSYQERVKEISGFIQTLSDRHDFLAKNQTAIAQTTEQAIQKFGAWGLQIQGRTTDVNKLIGSLVALRRQQALEMVSAAKTENQKLQGENNNDKTILNGQSGDIRHQTTMALADPRYDKVLAIVTRLRKTGRPEEGDLAALRAAGLDEGLTQSIENYQNIDGRIGGRTAQIATNQAMAIAPATTIADPRIQAFQDQQDKAKQALQARRTAAAKLPNAQRIPAMTKIDADAKAAYTTAQAQIGPLADQVGVDPQTGGASSVRKTLADSASLNDLAEMGGVDTGHKTPEQSKRLATRYKREATVAKTPAERKRLLDLAKSAAIDGLGPNANEDDLENVNSEYDVDNTRYENLDAKRGQSAAKKAQRSEGTRFGKDADSIKKQIEDVQSNFSLAPDDKDNEQNKLRELLLQFKTAREGQIKDTTDPAQLQKTLDDFRKGEFADYSAKILSGNLKQIADVMAKAAQSEASQTTSANLVKLAQGGDLADALSSTTLAITKAGAAKAQALIADYASSHVGFDASKGIPRALQEQLNEAATTTATDMVKARLDAISVAEKSSLDAINQRRSTFDVSEREQTRNSRAAGNLTNQGKVGSVQAFTFEQQQKESEVRVASRSVQDASAKKVLADDNLDQISKEISSAGGVGSAGKELSEKLAKAREEAQATDKALDDAKSRLRDLTAEVTPFKSASEAIAAAWDQFSKTSGIKQSPLNQLADGVKGSLDTAHSSMQKFFADMVSGSVKSKDAFRSLATSVISEIEQMAAKALTNEIFSLISSVVPGIGGGLPGASSILGGSGLSSASTLTSSFSNIGAMGSGLHFAAGGSVPHYASGGFNKDSVDAKLMPDEFVMNRSAVSMVGTDFLENLNSSGNHVRSAMPTVQSAMPKPASHSANVYVVAPGQQPQPGPRDFVQAITQDLLSNGQTKKLVKAIALGTA